MSNFHEVALFNCILMKNSHVLLIPDDVCIFLINFVFPKAWGRIGTFQGCGVMKRQW